MKGTTGWSVVQCHAGQYNKTKQTSHSKDVGFLVVWNCMFWEAAPLIANVYGVQE